MWHVLLSFLQKTVKLKAEARLDLLRQVGVAVDTWLKSAMNQVLFCSYEDAYPKNIT